MPEDLLNNALNTTGRFFAAHGAWVIQLCIVWLATWAINMLLQRLLRRTIARAPAQSWKGSVMDAAGLPVRVFVWVGGIAVALSILADAFPTHIIKTLLGLQPAFHTLIFGWFALRFMRRAGTVAVYKYPAVSVAQADMFQKIATAILVMALILLILPNFGISISGLLAFGGVGGIVIGLAAKDMLANIFGALMIYFDRPFAVGEWVHLPEKDIQGTVEHIGWRQVTVRTFDKRLLFIPNSMFGNLILMNPSKMTHRRIMETIGVRYQDIAKLPVIMEEIRTLLAANASVDKDAGIVVHLDKFNAYSVDMVVSAFTPLTEWKDYLAVKEAVLFGVNAIIVKHGAEIAFPTQVLQIERTAAPPREGLGS